MHEVGIISGVLDAVDKSVAANHADKVYAVNLSVGEETEVIKDCMDFAWEALTPGTVCEGAELHVNMIKPKSVCLACGNEFEHDRFHNDCPKCGSYETQLIAGHELTIDSIDVDIPDDESAEDSAEEPQENSDANAAPHTPDASAAEAYTDAMNSYADSLEKEYKQGQAEAGALSREHETQSEKEPQR